jgi:methionyl-tRNA formyltransferase
MIAQLLELGHKVAWKHEVKEIGSGDLAFFLSCGQIVPPEILKKHHHNLVVHESNLPEGKGWSPLTWQILEGKNEIPICLFEAQETVDSGEIYLKDTLKFKGTELVDELRSVQAMTTIEMCLKFVRGYPEIVLKAQKPKGNFSYYKKRKPQDSQIDVDKTIGEQFNLLRVVDNERYPAFFEIDGERFVFKIENCHFDH